MKISVSSLGRLLDFPDVHYERSFSFLKFLWNFKRPPMRPFMIILAAIVLPFSLLGQSILRMPENNLQLKSVRESKVRLDSVIITREPPNSREKIHYLYTPEGYNTKCVHYDFKDTTNQWVQTSIDSCTYDLNGRLTSWFIDGGKNNGDNMREFTYDPLGNLSTAITYQRSISDGSKWDGIFKEVFTYDKSKNITTIFKHDGLNSDDWYQTEKWDLYYLPDGRIEKILGYNCGGAYCDHSVDTVRFSYDAPNNISFIIDKALLDWPTPWVEIFKSEYSYDLNLQVIGWIHYNAWEGDGILRPDRRSEFIIDFLFNTRELILPYVFHDYSLERYLSWSLYWNVLFDYKIDERINYSGTGSVYNRIKYYYSNQTITGFKENAQGKSVVYPNPAKDFINFYVGSTHEPAKIEIYNNLGKMVMIDDLLPGKQISVKHLQRGFYIYKLSSQNTVETGKIILQ